MRPDVLAEHLGTTIRGLVAPLGLRVAELEAIGTREAIARDAVTASLGDLSVRIAALETREPIPGPPGPPGPPGRDGQDAKWSYLGVYVSGKTYDVGDLVTDHGSLFYCCTTTTARPESSPDWKLMVKRGRDGKDAK